MEKEEFYKKFLGLNSQKQSLEKVLKKLEKRSENLEGNIENVKGDMEILDSIGKVLEGLERKKFYHDYPGKYETAYYFVKSMPEVGFNDIERARPNKPTLYEPCPSCKKEMPVIMSYEQTYDSPGGDL